MGERTKPTQSGRQAMFVFDDRFVVELTVDQQRFMDTHGVGMGRFREANDRDTKVFETMSFGDFVTWLIEKTDLLVERSEY
jgi:hypothetical protein